MLHKSIDPNHSQRSWFSNSSTSSSQPLHPSIPKSMRLASIPSDYPASPYYQAYAPFPGPTPYLPSAIPVYPHAPAAGWVQAAPQIDAASIGVYTSGSYAYGVPQPPQSHSSSNGDPFYHRKRAPSDLDSHHHPPYQRSRNPSLTSISSHVGIHERRESDRQKTQSRESSMTIPHGPKAHVHPPSSGNPIKHDSKFANHFKIRIAPLLSGRTTDCPSIDWHVWDKMYSSAARDAKGQFCDTNMELDAFDPPIREPIFIKAIPGKADGFSIAIQRWGAIRVSPRRPGSSITVNDIMLAISLWMVVPIQPEDWKIFDKIFEKHVCDAFESRKMYAKVPRPLTGSAKDRAQVVDSLFCRVRWDGMVISEDFADSKTVYLRLKDASLRC